VPGKKLALHQLHSVLMDILTLT